MNRARGRETGARGTMARGKKTFPTQPPLFLTDVRSQGAKVRGLCGNERGPENRADQLKPVVLRQISKNL